jgi:uncharacterized protein (TIGR02284 family)
MRCSLVAVYGVDHASAGTHSLATPTIILQCDAVAHQRSNPMTTHENEIRIEKIGTLNDLIEATRDSANFYMDAAKSVDNPELRKLFDHMASSKSGLVGSMTKEVLAEGAEPATAGTFRGALREIYDDVRTSMGQERSDYSYVSELEKGEDQLMEAFHDVIKSDSAPKEVKESLRSYLPTVKAHHDTLRDRKWTMEARH